MENWMEEYKELVERQKEAEEKIINSRGKRIAELWERVYPLVMRVKYEIIKEFPNYNEKGGRAAVVMKVMEEMFEHLVTPVDAIGICMNEIFDILFYPKMRNSIASVVLSPDELMAFLRRFVEQRGVV